MLERVLDAIIELFTVEKVVEYIFIGGAIYWLRDMIVRKPDHRKLARIETLLKELNTRVSLLADDKIETLASKLTDEDKKVLHDFLDPPVG